VERPVAWRESQPSRTVVYASERISRMPWYNQNTATGPRMTSAEHYRIKAAEFSAMAESEPSPDKRAELATMAASYRRLAELADQNATAETPSETPTQHKSI
jgi:hypothetical protein